MSLFTRRLLIVVCCGVAVLVLVGNVTLSYRSRIRPVVWHLLHGSSATVAGYRVRVPRGWFVEQRSATDAQWWNTRTGESIWFHSFPKSPNFTLEFWSHLVQEHKQTGDAEIRVLEQRYLQIAGTSFLCLEQDYAVKLPPSATRSGPKELHLPSVDCKSAGPLDATFYGGMHVAPRHNYEEFYSLLASIKKQ